MVRNTAIRRCITFLLTLSMVVGAVCFAATPDVSLTPNQDLLNAMISGNRTWVIDTLVLDKRSTNPMAIALYADDENSLAKDALRHYYGIDMEGENAQAAYRALVNAMYFAYNVDEYTKGFFDEVGELIGWAVGLFTGDEIRSTAETLNRTRQEIHYDNLLKSVFTADYTASDGTTLLDTEASLTMLKQLQEVVQYCTMLTNHVSAHNDLVADASSNLAITTEYITDYALPYGDSASRVLTSIAELSAGGSSYEDLKTAQVAADLALVAKMAVHAPDGNLLDYYYFDFLGDYLEGSGVSEVMDLLNVPLDLTDTALEKYLFLESIQQQRDIIAGPLERLANTTDDNDMRESVNNFGRLMREEYNRQFLSWDSIQSYLRNNQVAGTAISKLTSGMIKKSLHLTDNYLLGATVAKAAGVLSISAWISDQLIGLKEICEKTFELLYWEDLMTAAVDSFYIDLAAYRDNKNEETAGAVLDDLQLLQRLRLYGEKTAYAIGSAPNNTWFGWVVTDGESAQVAWDTLYQRSVDVLMAASIVPPLTDIRVGSGERMMIEYMDGAGFVARCGSRCYVELPLRLAGGITCSGTLIIDATGRRFGAGFIELGSSGSLLLTGGRLTVGELTQKGGTLVLGETASIVCTERLCLGSPTVQNNGEGLAVLKTKDLELSGTADCAVNASGDVSGVSVGSVTQLTLSGNTQTASGTVKVTGTLSAPGATILDGKNIQLTGGKLSGSYWRGDLSLLNASVGSTRFTGSVYDKGGSTYAGSPIVEQLLHAQGVSTVSAGANVSVYGTANFDKAPTGSGTMRIYGDLSSADNESFSPELILSGNSTQDVSGAFSAKTLRFANTGRGVTVQKSITVSELLTNPSGEVTTLQPVILADGAELEGNFSGSLSAKNWAIPDGTVIGGDLTLQSGGTFSGSSADVEGKLILPGSGTLDTIALTAGELSSPEALTLLNMASLDVQGRATLGGTLESPTEIAIAGDLVLNGLQTADALRVKGDVIVSGTTKLGTLTLDGVYRQEIAGSSFTVCNLNLHNSSGRPLKLAQTITVTGMYDNPSVQLLGGAIKGGLDVSQGVTSDTTVQGNLNLSVPLTVTDCTLTVSGSVSTPSITLQNAQLIVNGDLTLSSGTVTVIDEGSALTVGGAVYANGGSITLGGDMEVRTDLLLSSTTLSGGDLTIGGDLYGTAALRPENLTLNGLIRQRLGPTNLHFGSLTLLNSSRGGVLLEKKIYYSGTYTPGTSALFNSGNLIKEAA